MGTVKHEDMSSRSAFPLLRMLEVMPGVLQDHLLPALQDRHKAALAGSCTALRQFIQQNVRCLQLYAGSCCTAQEHSLSDKMPAITDLRLKPGNLHEAMFVLPMFFLQGAGLMTGITSLQLLDQLPERPPTEIKCDSCTAWTSTYDLAAILVTAATCMPRLATLDFATHYISDAECAAIALMTGLTHLQLRSTHGTKTGGIARFTSLQNLAELCLLDSNLRCDPADIAMLLGRNCLTSLQLGFHPTMLPPFLHSLLELQEKASQAAPGSSRQPAATAETAARAAAQRLRAVSDSTADHALAVAAASRIRTQLAGIRSRVQSRDIACAVPPPPLKRLSIVLSPYMSDAGEAFAAVAALTGLTRLHIGWLVRPGHGHQVLTAVAVLPIQDQVKLSQMVSLKALGVGWTPERELLGAIACFTGLTELHLGRLPVEQPIGMSLPSVKRLTAHLRPPPLLALNWLHECRRALDTLASFPGLTRLELTGAICGEALQQLPSVTPKQLQELLLPLSAVQVDRQSIGALKDLSHLTSLRLGWRSPTHKGPHTIPDEGFDAVAWAQHAASLAALTQPTPAVLPELEPQSLAHATNSRSSTIATASAAGYFSVASTTAAAAPALAICPTCVSAASSGCLCKLQQLEIVGPMPGLELLHLTSLPALRTVILRDNLSWSSGLPVTDLVKFAASSSSLRLLQIISCDGLDGLEVERALQAQSPEGWTRVDVVVRGGGRTAPELGLGYQYMGTLLTAAQERGDPLPAWDADDPDAAGVMEGPELPTLQLQHLHPVHAMTLEVLSVAQQTLQQVQQAQQQQQQPMGVLASIQAVVQGLMAGVQQLQQVQGAVAQAEVQMGHTLNLSFMIGDLPLIPLQQVHQQQALQALPMPPQLGAQQLQQVHQQQQLQQQQVDLEDQLQGLMELGNELRNDVEGLQVQVEHLQQQLEPLAQQCSQLHQLRSQIYQQTALLPRHYLAALNNVQELLAAQQQQEEAAVQQL